jgi:transcription elongation factor GreA
MLARTTSACGLAASEDARLLDSRLRATLGYRVVAPDGDLGVVAGVPLVGQPPRSLVLVVRDGVCMRFVSVLRVAEVLTEHRRVLLWPHDKRRLSPGPGAGARWGLRPMARARGEGHARPRAGLGRAFPDREESEVSALPAPTVDDDVLVTADGYEQLCAELEALRTVGRQEMAKHLREVREDGDPDNPVLFDLFEEQAQLERRIAVLEAQAAAAHIVAPATDGTAGIGSCVRVRHGGSGEVAEYHLVGAIEADVGNGRVSVGAPVGRALVGRRRGDAVAVDTPRGTTQLEILSVRPVAQRAARKAA